MPVNERDDSLPGPKSGNGTVLDGIAPGGVLPGLHLPATPQRNGHSAESPDRVLPDSSVQPAPSPFAEFAEQSQRETANILGLDLSEEVLKWCEQYRRVGERDLYLWRWCAYAVDLLTLSCVDADWRKDVCETKFLCGMWNCLLDDVADQMHDRHMLSVLLGLSRGQRPDWNSVPDHQRDYGRFAERVWEQIWLRARRYPQFELYQRLLEYDLKQLANTVEYSQLLHERPMLMNLLEHELYSSQGMMVNCGATLDLMVSSTFDLRELGKLREATFHGQWMARNGNLISTWEREISDADFTSGVFAYAVNAGIFRAEELGQLTRDELVRQIRGRGIEHRFFEDWQRHRKLILELEGQLRSIDLKAYVAGLDRLFISELGSRGFK